MSKPLFMGSMMSTVQQITKSKPASLVLHVDGRDVPLTFSLLPDGSVHATLPPFRARDCQACAAESSSRLTIPEEKRVEIRKMLERHEARKIIRLELGVSDATILDVIYSMEKERIMGIGLDPQLTITPDGLHVLCEGHRSEGSIVLDLRNVRWT
jgi:hypothetical protein